jgi:hypothetical protein
LKRYGITGVFNDREHGKTTYMVKRILKGVNTGEYDQAYSNIHIGPKVDKEGHHYGHPKIHFVDYSELIALTCPTREGLPTAIVAIDQVSNYIDSRASMSKLNREFSRFVRESRQHGVDMIYTTWMRSEVDKRLRPFTDLFVMANQRKGGGFWYELIERKTKDFLPQQVMPLQIAKQVWTYFDSTELIEDSTIPK